MVQGGAVNVRLVLVKTRTLNSDTLQLHYQGNLQDLFNNTPVTVQQGLHGVCDLHCTNTTSPDSTYQIISCSILLSLNI